MREFDLGHEWAPRLQWAFLLRCIGKGIITIDKAVEMVREGLVLQ